MFKSFVCLALVAFHPVSSQEEVNNQTERSNNNRIIGGRPATPGELPYQLSLMLNGKHECGAVLIRSHFGNLIALTAAHCIPKNATLSAWKLVAGTTSLNQINQEEAQSVGLKRVIIHKDFKPNKTGLRNDIAILLPSTKIIPSKWVQPINLPAPWLKYHRGNLTVSGWGLSSENPAVHPTDLQVLSIPVVPNKRCAQLFAPIYGNAVRDSNICGGFPTEIGLSPCYGDSGGPATGMVRGKLVLIGLVSWGRRVCTDPGQPSVYTRVSSYTLWITKNVILE